MIIAQFFVLVCTLYATTDASVAIIPYEPSSNQKSHCFSDNKEIGGMNNGEEKTLKSQCVRAVCGANRDIQLQGCGSVSAEPPCQVSEGDLSRPYPECCPSIGCP